MKLSIICFRLVDEQRYTYPYQPAIRLSDHFNKPGIIEINRNLDKLTRGLSTQPQMNTDQYFDREV